MVCIDVEVKIVERHDGVFILETTKRKGELGALAIA